MTGPELTRCDWAIGSEVMRAYHDAEWGKPVRDETKLFEYLILDGFQAGLSWEIVLRRREGFRKAFHGFDPVAVAAMEDAEMAGLLENAAIIRNRSKIAAARANAVAFLDVATEHGLFATYLWSFVADRTIQNNWGISREIPAETTESQALSKDMRRRGFKFAGPTIVYAVMQSAGLVNDHVVTCFRHAELTV